jgi:hypothetical protein
MIRLGILDFDTSHVVEFTKRLNHKKAAEEQWVDGAEVVIACPGESKMSPERIPGFKKELDDLGVPLVEKPEAMIGKVDGMLIESLQGSVHFDRAKPFLEAGIPCYIDKPFANSVADARKIVDLAAKKKVPLFSSSSLRYATEVVQYKADPKPGKLLGAIVYGPAPLSDGNPGWFNYGIHIVEMLYALMGPGCERVTCTHEKDADVVTGQWKDGRLGTARGMRSAKINYGFVAFSEQSSQALTVSTGTIYRELLKQIVSFFKEGKAPVDIAETVEIIAFLEATWKSAMNHGAGEAVGA